MPVNADFELARVGGGPPEYAGRVAGYAASHFSIRVLGLVEHELGEVLQDLWEVNARMNVLVVELAAMYSQLQLRDAPFHVHVLDWNATKSPGPEERAQEILQHRRTHESVSIAIETRPVLLESLEVGQLDGRAGLL